MSGYFFLGSLESPGTYGLLDVPPAFNPDTVLFFLAVPSAFMASPRLHFLGLHSRFNVILPVVPQWFISPTSCGKDIMETPLSRIFLVRCMLPSLVPAIFANSLRWVVGSNFLTNWSECCEFLPVDAAAFMLPLVAISQLPSVPSPAVPNASGAVPPSLSHSGPRAPCCWSRCG